MTEPTNDEIEKYAVNHAEILTAELLAVLSANLRSSWKDIIYQQSLARLKSFATDVSIIREIQWKDVKQCPTNQ